MDVIPNYSLERQRLELERAQFLLNIQSQTFRIAQAKDEIARIEENIKATKVTITELTATIDNLQSTS